MKDELISFETAKLAKEKRFEHYSNHTNIFYVNAKEILELEWDLFSQFYCISKDKYIKVYNEQNAYARPTQSLLQRWLREKHNISIWVGVGYYLNQLTYDVTISYIEKDSKIFKEITPRLTYDTFWEFSDEYEEALEVGLIEALKLIKI